jgi:hypothetical protein
MKTTPASRRHAAHADYAEHKALFSDVGIQPTPLASEDEIPLQVAVAAFSGTSWSPEARGEYIRKGYVTAVNEAYADLQRSAQSPARQALLDREFPALKRRFRAAFMEWLAARSRTTSWMITGPAGRNNRREANRADTADRRRENMEEVLERGKERIKKEMKEIRIEERGGVIGDLQKRLAKAERDQEATLAANKVLRSKLSREEQAEKLRAMGYHERSIAEVMRPDMLGNYGRTFNTTNNAAEIRRLRARIAEEEQRATMVLAAALTPDLQTSYPFTGSAAYPYAGTVEYDYPGRRILLRFSVRIPREVFDEIRRTTGFNWSRTQNAFSAVMGSAAVYAAKRITGADLPSVV